MRRFSLPHGLALTILLSGVLASVTVASAQSRPETVEDVSLRPGSIFEIYANTTSSSSQVSWVLTKNGVFAQADRGPFFSFRPSEAGQYLLSGEMTDAGQPPVRMILRLDVRQDVPLIELATKAEKNVLTRIFPAPDGNNIVSLVGTKRLVRLDVIQNDIELLALDANTELDTNGDGDSQNDNILGKSIFSSGEGSLHIWLPKNLTSQKMLLAAKFRNGSFVTQPIEIVTDTYYEILRNQAEAEELARKERTKISSTQQEGDTYKISVQTEDGVLPQAPLLYFWDFGDGTQSLLNRPNHTYADMQREYRITLRIVNLTDGSEVLNASQMVFIGKSTEPEITPPTTEEPNGEVTEPSTEEPKEDSPPKAQKEKGSLVSTILKAVLGLAASVGIGMLAVFLFAKIKGKSLQDSLEKVEKKLVGTTEDVTEPAAPMEITAPIDAEIVEEDLAPKEEVEKKDAPEEAAKAEVPQEKTPEIHRQVPSWLAPSPAEGVDIPATPAAPPSPPPPPPPPPKPAEPTATAPAKEGAHTATQTSTTIDTPPVVDSDKKPEETPPAQAPAATPPWLAGTEGLTQNLPPPPPPPPAPPAQSQAALAQKEVSNAAASTASDNKKLPTETPTQPKAPTPVPPAKESATAPTPPWLTNVPSTPQKDVTSTPPTAAPAATAGTPPPATPTPQSATSQAAPTPAWLTNVPSTPVQKSPAATTPSPATSQETVDITQKSAGEMTPEERERERKRKKRQRYRANKRERERTADTENTDEWQAEKVSEQAPSQEEAPQSPVSAPVPAWLQSTPPSVAPVAPVTEAVTTPNAPAPTPSETKPISEPEQKAPEPVKKDAVPAWLQSASVPPAPAAPAKEEKKESPPPPQAPQTEDGATPAIESQTTSAPVPSWLQSASTAPSTSPPPPPPAASPIVPQETTQPAVTEPQKTSNTQLNSAPVPEWLKMTPDTPVTTDIQSQEPQKQAADEDIKFVISADSLGQESQVFPSEGDIPLQEKEGE